MKRVPAEDKKRVRSSLIILALTMAGWVAVAASHSEVVIVALRMG